MKDQTNKIINPNNDDQESTKELPRIFKTWNQLYLFVIIQLIVLIGLFYWFSKSFD